MYRRIGYHVFAELKMKKLTKIGLAFCGIGIVVGAIPLLSLALYLSWHPLSAPLPLEPGSTLKRAFHVRTSGRYFVEVACKPIGPMKEMAENYLNIEDPITPHVHCDISAKILHSGTVVTSANLSALKPAGIIVSKKMLVWDLLHADLPSAGNYELEIVNRSGLRSWQLSEPTVEINLNLQNATGTKVFGEGGAILGYVLFIVGLILCVISRLRRRVRKTTANVAGA